MKENAEKTQKKERKISLSICMGTEEHRLFKEAAKEEGRSLSSWITYHLRQKLKEQNEQA